MTEAELDVIAKGLAPVVKEYIASAIAKECRSIFELLAVLEQRQAVPGRDGRDADPEFIKAEVAKAVALLPVPKDGLNGKDGTAGRDGKDAEHVDPDDVVAKTVKHVAPLIRREIDMALALLPKAADGTGIASALIDRDGHLVLALTNGDVKDVGRVAGRDGDHGAKGDAGVSVTGPQGDKGDPGESIKGEKGDVGEPGRDGRNGIDGIDLGPDDLLAFGIDAEARTAVLTFRRGDREKTLTAPVISMPVYRNVYVNGKTYEPGDVVTLDGAMWIANAETSSRPGLTTEASRAWRMCVKSGRDGKAGALGPQGPAGKDGVNGRDLTHVTLEGQKY